MGELVVQAGSGIRQETAVAGEQVWVAQKTLQPGSRNLHFLYQADGKKPHKVLPWTEEALVHKYLEKYSGLLVIKKKNPQIKTTTRYHFSPFKLTTVSLKLTGISKQEFLVTADERAG